MEWLLYITVYLGVAFFSSIFITRSGYQSLLKTDKTVAEKDHWSHQRAFEDIAKDEAARRARLSKIARIWGIWLGMLWFITWPTEFLILIFSGLVKVHSRMSIEPLNQDFENQLGIHKAQKMVDEYNAEQKTKFEKELESK